MSKLRCAYFTALLIFGLTHGAAALTLESGQVLSSDGQVYDGASPEQQEALIAKSKETGWFGAEGKKSGVQGSSVYVVVQDELVFVPLKDIKGKSKEGITKVIKDRIVDTLMADTTAKIIASEGSIDPETMERLNELANDPVTAEIAAQIAEDAAGDPAMAEALTEATLAIATVDIDNAAEVAAAEASYEAAFEAAHAQKCAGGPGSADGC
ncbi:hypothetical protein AB3X55_00980 [Alphaproteobacteria bacterium LSUCC0719]